MGCDIHMYREKQVNGKWLTADIWESEEYGDGSVSFDVDYKKRFTDRNYQLFGLLSKGVREEYEFSFEPRGVPFNACPEYVKKVDDYGSDGHSHSYLYLHELKDMASFLDSFTIKIAGMKDKESLEKLNKSIESGNPDWDLLFPYCQWTNQPNHVHFEIDVPASFYIGRALNRIISMFNGVNGENHRVVFFFDN